MATNPINMVDAVAEVIPRVARNKTATLRVGKVVSVTGGTATVLVGAANIKVRFHTYYTPVANDIVSLITENDVWLILGKIKT